MSKSLISTIAAYEPRDDYEMERMEEDLDYLREELGGERTRDNEWFEEEIPAYDKWAKSLEAASESA